MDADGIQELDFTYADCNKSWMWMYFLVMADSQFPQSTFVFPKSSHHMCSHAKLCKMDLIFPR